MDESFTESQLPLQTQGEEVVPRFQRYQAIVSEGCCSLGCVSRFPFSRVLALQKSFSTLTGPEKRGFIKDFFMQQAYGPFGRFVYMVDGKRVCRSCWKFVHDIKSTWYYDALKRLRSGKFNLQRAVPIRRRSIAAVSAHVWLLKHAEETGDQAPDSSKIFLSSCMTKKEVFHLYELEEHPCVSYATFLSMWREKCPNIRLRKSSPFSKCGVCVLLREASSRTRNQDFRKWLQYSKERHVEQQSMERAAYYKHRSKAEGMPHRYASIILDGMDQKKTNIPHFREQSKASRTEFYKLHVTGAISHGSRETYIYLDQMQWSHDSDHTMNVLLKTLLNVAKDGRLPPVLYVQMDNCWRENKNRFVFGLCSWLVYLKIVRKIRLSYLMVGHTHEDIDQRFSKISASLKQNNAVTLDLMTSLIEKSQTPRPLVSNITCLYGIKEWLDPHLKKVKHHTKPHAFKFLKASDGTVECFYKMWAKTLTWKGPIHFLNTLPVGAPNFLRPQYVKQVDLEVAKTCIATCFARLRAQEVVWWDEFLEVCTRTREYWRLTELGTHASGGGWIVSQFEKTEDVVAEETLTAEDALQMESISDLLSRETGEPEILVIESRKKKTL